jgi:hypothetical protein
MNTESVGTKVRHRPFCGALSGLPCICDATRQTVFAHELQRHGGTWLATARQWLQSSVMNGDRVRWNSGDIIHMTVMQFEEAASHIAAAAINDDRRMQARSKEDL